MGQEACEVHRREVLDSLLINDDEGTSNPNTSCTARHQINKRDAVQGAQHLILILTAV